MKGNGEFLGITAEQIEAVLKLTTRQYLVGNLGRPQELPHVPDQHVEIGITHYVRATPEAPHWHTLQREYQYVLSGMTSYREVERGTEHTYRAGDFYAILPEVCYTQASEPGTRILFVKHPAINDKVTCRSCDRANCPARVEQCTPGKPSRE